MQTIIVLLILMVAAFFLIRRLMRTLGKTNPGGCGCGCDGCDPVRRDGC